MSYKEEERQLFKGLQGKHLKSLKHWLRCFCVKWESCRCNQIASLHMFDRRENKFEQEMGTTQSGKRYRVDTRKRSHDQDSKTFIENNYNPLLNESESEREERYRDNPHVTSQYSPFQLESLQKEESNNSQGVFCFHPPLHPPSTPPTTHPHPLNSPPPPPSPPLYPPYPSPYFSPSPSKENYGWWY